MQDFATPIPEQSKVARTPKTPKDSPAVVSLKVTPDVEKIWEELVSLYPDVTKHAIGVAALRYGLLAILKEPKVLMEMEQEAVKAKWAAILPKTK